MAVRSCGRLPLACRWLWAAHWLALLRKYLCGLLSCPSFFSCGACICSLIGTEVISVNMSKSGHSLRMEASLVSVQTPLLTSSMILGKLFNLSEALFPFL